jgi:LacI family transcriptional regulator
MTTLKDLAARAGVSIVTVHKCIYGKPGVSEETRRRVLRIVDDMHYMPPGSALSKRKSHVTLVVICPDTPLAENSFYLSLQQGAAHAARELESRGSHVRVRLCDGSWFAQSKLLDEISAQDDVDGLVTCCLDDTILENSFSHFQRRGIPVVTFNSDAPISCRLAYVTPPNQRMGALAAELLCKMGQHHRLLIVGGNKRRSNLRDNTLGFYSYIQRHHPEASLLELNDTSTQDLCAELTSLLTTLDDISGIYCSMTSNSILVCRVLHELGLQHQIRLICTDVFPELQPYMEDGTVDATIWQSPKSQSYNAVMLLYFYLTTGQLQTEYLNIQIAPVMRSNFEDFCK